MTDQKNKYPLWSFGGATSLEWFSGLVVFCLIGFLSGNASAATMMPFMWAGWILTTFALAYYRIRIKEKLTYKEALLEEKKNRKNREAFFKRLNENRSKPTLWNKIIGIVLIIIFIFYKELLMLFKLN